MSIFSGEWSTSAVYGGSYYGWHERWVPLQVSIVDPTLKKHLETPSTLQPCFSVEVEDVVTRTILPVPNVKEITISRNVEGQADQFTLSMVDAEKVSPRMAGAMNGQLANDQRKRIRIYGGYVIAKIPRKLRIFAGVILDRGEEWNSDGSTMSVQGLSLSYLLTGMDGALADYHGSVSGAVMELLALAGIQNYVFGFQDRLIPNESPANFIGPTLEDTLSSLFSDQAEVTWFLDDYGTLVIRKKGSVVGKVMDFQAGKNLIKMSPTSSSRGVLSEVSVQGANAASSQTVVSVQNLAKYGRRRGSLSSPVITTSSGAQAAGLEEIRRSMRALSNLSMLVHFNPILEALMRVGGKLPRASIDTTVDVLRFSHRITANDAKTTIDGEADIEL